VQPACTGSGLICPEDRRLGRRHPQYSTTKGPLQRGGVRMVGMTYGDVPLSRDAYVDPYLDISADPAVVKLLRDALQDCAEHGDDPVRAELAREILAGRMRASEIMSVPAYREALTSGLEEFLRSQDSLTEAERLEQERQAHRQLDAIRSEVMSGKDAPAHDAPTEPASVVQTGSEHPVVDEALDDLVIGSSVGADDGGGQLWP